MSDRTTNVSEQGGAIEPLSTSELIDRLSRFEGPPEAFLVNLLAVQCYLSAAAGGAILRTTGEGRIEVLAIYPQMPQGATAPVWLAQSVEQAPNAIQSAITAIKPMRTDDDLYGAPARQHLIMVPIRGSSNVRGVACFMVDTADAATLSICRERLELTVSLLSLYEMRLTLQRRQMDLARLRMSMDVLGAINEHTKFAGAAMAACNELASRLQADRVSLGFLKGRYVHLKAQSHTEKFNRKMKIVQDIEAAMEECLDQDVEILYPSTPEATYVSRASKELSTRHGQTALVSLPIRQGGEVVAVLSVERALDRPFNAEEVEMLRLACDLCSARLVSLHQTDRWVGAKAAMATRKLGALAVGPKHTWIKLLVIGVATLLTLSIFLKGNHTADAKFTLEPVKQQAVPAVFDGYIEGVYVKPGDRVMGRGTDRGEWTAAALYKSGEEVAFNGRQYRCRSDHRSAEDNSTRPDLDTTRWQDFHRGAWADKASYAKGEVVDFDGRPYGCLTAHRGTGDASTRPDEDRDHWALAVLGRLETKELEAERDKALLDLAKAQTSADIARGAAQADPTKTAEAQLAEIEMEQALEKSRLLERLIRESSLKSRIDGIVISEDLTRHLRRPVKKGEVLFEVASPDNVRAVLEVPEDQIVEVREKVQQGKLATAAYPQQKVGFTVDMINPVADVVEQQNVFKVRVTLNNDDVRSLPGHGEWMRPGYKGSAKIHLGKESYLVMALRKPVNWVQMKAWEYLPF